MTHNKAFEKFYAELQKKGDDYGSYEMAKQMGLYTHKYRHLSEDNLFKFKHLVKNIEKEEGHNFWSQRIKNF